LDDRTEEFTLISNYFGVTLDWLIFQDLCRLPDVGRFIFPDKEDRHTFEGVDQWEKEVLNEILVVNCLEIIQRSHQIYYYLTKVILAIRADACGLE
jgi:hypothetical protein